MTGACAAETSPEDDDKCVICGGTVDNHLGDEPCEGQWCHHCRKGEEHAGRDCDV